jgi:hypothetical protein
MGNGHDNDNKGKSFKRDILLVLFTGIIGFLFGLFGDFYKTAVAHLQNYNAIKVETEKPVYDEKNIELRYEIYKLGNKSSSFYFDFELTKQAKEIDIKIAERPIPKEISESVLEHGDITFIDYDIEDGNGSLHFKNVTKENKFEVIIKLVASDKTQVSNGFLKLNVKPKDPSEKVLKASLWDFSYNSPHITTIPIAFILLIGALLGTYYIIVILKRKKKGEPNDAEE